MTDDLETRRAAAAAAVAALAGTAITDRRPLSVLAAAVGGEPIPRADAGRLSYRPLAVGEPWGAAWDTWWFRLTGRVPTSWAGRAVTVRIGLGEGWPGFSGEGLLYREGVPVAGVGPRHEEYQWAKRAAGGEEVRLEVEAAANPQAFGRQLPVGVDAGGPLTQVLAAAELVLVDEDVRGLTLDCAVLLESMPTLASSDAPEVLAAVESALDAAAAGEAGAGRRRVARWLAAPPSGRSRVLAVGNSHLDTAWLWPYRETRRKIARTVATMLALMDRYPDYTFALSQPQQVAWLREDHPTLFERLSRRVAEGRVEPVGAMWVEPDCNLTSGESLLRQMLHGQRFWRDAFGCEAAEVWLPDVFGYGATLPTLMNAAGLHRFVTQKLSWNDTNTFPYNTFWWEGLDGSRVLAHFPPAATYTGTFDAAEVARAALPPGGGGRAGLALYLYGYGDGGGGPTPEQLERARRMGGVASLPAVDLGRVATFFEGVESRPGGVPEWVGELYLEKHRGTYTTHADFKRSNRRLEQLLLAAELWCAEAYGADSDYPAEALDTAWKTLLRNQFHDVLPGTSITWVHQEARREHAETERAVDAVVLEAQRRIADVERATATSGGTQAFNAAPVRVQGVVDLDGTPLWVDVPPLGHAPVRIGRARQRPDGVAPVERHGRSFANGLVRVEWDEAGHLVSVQDLVLGREVVPQRERANLLQLSRDKPREWDAWDIDRESMSGAVDVLVADRVEVVEESPLRMTLVARRRFGPSTFEQRVSLAAGARRVDFETTVDWHHEHTLLKVAFPVDVRASQATCEVAFGHVRRPTRPNTSWELAKYEVPAHRWVDLSEDGFGAALLNDGRYGHDVADRRIRMSLLRSPLWPDATADRGVSTVRYALVPHDGDWRRAGVLDEAARLNTPLRFVDGAALPASPDPLVAVDAPGVVVTAVKRAEDGEGLVVRVVESFGGTRSATVRPRAGRGSVQDVDALERPLGAPRPLHPAGERITLRPFEIRTLRFR